MNEDTSKPGRQVSTVIYSTESFYDIIPYLINYSIIIHVTLINSWKFSKTLWYCLTYNTNSQPIHYKLLILFCILLDLE